MNNILTHEDLSRIYQALGADDQSTVELLDKVWGMVELSEKRGNLAMMPVQPTGAMFNEYYSKSVAPISRLSIHGYKGMIKAVQEFEL